MKEQLAKVKAAVANKTSVRAQAKLVKEYEGMCEAEGITAFPRTRSRLIGSTGFS